VSLLPPIAPPAPARAVLPARARLRAVPGPARIAPRAPIPVVYPAGHDDRLLLVQTATSERDGKRLAEVRGWKTTDNESWVLNGVGSYGFGCSAWNDAMEHLVAPGTVVDRAGTMRLIGREVQRWRDGNLIWAGPLVTGHPLANGTVTFGANDLGWHLYRKFFGAAERRDLLLGFGSMDSPTLSGWIVNGAVTKTQDTGDKVRGAGSMRLSGTGSVTRSFTQPARQIMPPVRLTGRVKVPTGTPVGTLIARITTRTADGDLIDQVEIRTDESTVLGTWQLVGGSARQANGIPVTSTVYLSSPGIHGDTKFDDVRALENNTTGTTHVNGDDLVRHIEAGLRHIQNDAGQGPGFGFGLRILDFTGTVEVIGERHVNHLQFSDFLTRYTSRDDGLDWRIDPLARELVVGPRIGVDHDNIALHDRSVRAGGYLHDETSIAAKTVVPGDSDGYDRAEGGWLDATDTDGIVYDDFFQPPAGTPLSALDPIAKQRHAQVSQAQTTLDDLAISDEYLGVVNPGDTIPGSMRIGWFRLPGGRRRIGQVTLNAEAGQLELV
jgi:hypothetical protein